MLTIVRSVGRREKQNNNLKFLRQYNTVDHYFYDQSVEKWAAKEANRMSLKAYCAFGPIMSKRKLIKSAAYVQNELGIRLARELQNFHDLPYVVMSSPYMAKVFDLYLTAFKKITQIPEIDSEELEETFSKTLEGSVNNCTGIVELLALGIYEAANIGSLPPDSLNVHLFLDRFIINRIARRVLAEQHLVLRQNPNNPEIVGVISPKCEIEKCIMRAFESVSEDVKGIYGSCPSIIIKGDIEATIPYIVKHLVYIMIELLSNSVTAVLEKHKGGPYPPIQVLIVPGLKVTTIRISDCGGGIPKESMKKIFQYGFTTNKTRQHIKRDPMGMIGGASVEPNPIGFGFGLPLARLYAMHFGGNLKIVSMDGYGCDSFLSLDQTGDVLEKFEL